MIKNIKKEQWLIGVLLVILLLVIIVPIPKEKEDTNVMEPQIYEDVLQGETIAIEQQLKEILQKISGVGQVEVLITYEDNGRTIVEKDQSISEELVQEADSSGGTRTTTTSRNEKETVYENDETPYVVQELSPQVKGILVVAEGGGNVSVKKQIQETIEALFGLEAHKISIMKMELSN